MKRIVTIPALLVLAASLACAQADANSSVALEKVLAQMDTAAVGFRTADADFVWDQYQKVVDETDTQKGRVYFRRTARQMEMAADVSFPERKYALFAGDKVRLYQPRIEQVTEYGVGKNKAEFEAFLVLGFGGRGHDLLKQFSVRYVGADKLDGVPVAVLELTPLSARVHGSISRILMWVDATRGISLKQQMFEPSGDYRTAVYTNIHLNGKLEDDVFKLKTTAKTRVISPP